MRKRFKHMPTDSYFYLARQLNDVMTSNSCGLIRTQNRNTQKMNNLCGLVRTQNYEIAYYKDKSDSKRVNVIKIAFSTDCIKLKCFHKVNTRTLKDTKHEEPSVTNISKF